MSGGVPDLVGSIFPMRCHRFQPKTGLSAGDTITSAPREWID